MFNTNRCYNQLTDCTADSHADCSADCSADYSADHRINHYIGVCHTNRRSIKKMIGVVVNQLEGMAL